MVIMELRCGWEYSSIKKLASQATRKRSEKL